MVSVGIDKVAVPGICIRHMDYIIPGLSALAFLLSCWPTSRDSSSLVFKMPRRHSMCTAFNL